MPMSLDAAQNFLALEKELEGSGRGLGSRTLRRANRVVNKATEAGTEVGEGDYLNALSRISRRGALGGKRAKGMVEAIELGNVDENEALVASRGQDDIARAYQTMSESLAGTLGVDMDTASPAVLDAVRRYTEGRSSDTTRYLSQVKESANLQRNQILAGQVAQTFDETGMLVESLRMLEEEQSLLNKAQMGATLGTFLGPVGGAAGGGLLGGWTGASAGAQSGMDTLATIVRALGMTKGM